MVEVLHFYLAQPLKVMGTDKTSLAVAAEKEKDTNPVTTCQKSFYQYLSDHSFSDLEVIGQKPVRVMNALKTSPKLCGTMSLLCTTILMWPAKVQTVASEKQHCPMWPATFLCVPWKKE